jgi:crotonobetainyl-CoA:carnitine CoA-transferase CaiB-like acyl-CoA transferase
MSGVLDGVRVLEVASWTFVPSAGAVLSDWGADVIKIEHPETGDPQRGLITSGLVPSGPSAVNFMMEQPNRGKRSVGLDIATPGGLELLYRLAETSDVFLTNFLPPARRRLKIDVDHIRARNPNIIYARGTGQGVKGPDADKGGYDGASFWARGGLAATLTPAGLPWPIGQRPAMGDLPGGMTIAGGIAAALFSRERTGEPRVVDVSLLGLAAWMLSPDIVASKLFGEVFESKRFTREDLPNPIVNNYRTKDGRFISLMMLESDRYWADLCRHVGRPDLIDDPRFVDSAARFENRKECIALLDELFASRTLSEWRQALATVEGVWAVAQTVREIHDDPQAVANGYLPEVKSDDGAAFTLVASPVQFDETAVQLRPGPEHGQHTEEVLLELGLTWEEIVEHKAANSIL